MNDYASHTIHLYEVFFLLFVFKRLVYTAYIGLSI